MTTAALGATVPIATLVDGDYELDIEPGTQPATELVRKARRAYANLHSLVIHERLASSTRYRLTTTWQIVAPDRPLPYAPGARRACEPERRAHRSGRSLSRALS